jgi:hypothetical protein
MQPALTITDQLMFCTCLLSVVNISTNQSTSLQALFLKITLATGSLCSKTISSFGLYQSRYCESHHEKVVREKLVDTSKDTSKFVGSLSVRPCLRKNPEHSNSEFELEFSSR